MTSKNMQLIIVSHRGVLIGKECLTIIATFFSYNEKKLKQKRKYEVSSAIFCLLCDNRPVAIEAV